MANHHGDFIWYELLTKDADAAARFYGAVVGWQMRAAEGSDRGYRIFSIRGEDVGGAGLYLLSDLAGGVSADLGLVEEVRKVLAAAQTFSHVVDGRFKGGYITRRYGAPAQCVHALQMELAQIAYMDERPPFAYRDECAALLRPVLRRCIETLIAWATERNAARS